MTIDSDYSPTNTPLYDIFRNLLSNHTVLKIILSFTLLILQALLLKRILSTNDLTPKNSLLPAFLYILLMSSFSNFQNIQPLLFANFFLIIALQNILAAYSNPESYEQIFIASLMISLGSFFYFPVIFFTLFIFLVFLIFSILKWREWIISLLGFLIPYLFLFSYYFLTDIIENKLHSYILFFKNIGFLHPKFTASIYIYFSLLSIYFILAFFSTYSRLSERSIFYRKKIIVLIMFIIISLVSIFFSKEFFMFHLCLLFIPFSFFIPNYMLQIKKFIISEIMYLLLFGTWVYIYLV